jgi:hypothetical protein
MKSTIKNRLDDLERQLAGRTTAPTMIIINVVNASLEGPLEIVPAGYTCDIKGRRVFFPGNAEQAGMAVRAHLALEPKTPGKVRPVPVLVAYIYEPTIEGTPNEL